MRNFKLQEDVFSSYAYFSEDGKNRFYLRRFWDEMKLIGAPKYAMFIGLNPSTANDKSDDPTIRRCINFARSWGYGGMYMCNLFSYVSTDPDKIITSEAERDLNDYHLKNVASMTNKIIFAWGAFKQHKARMEEVIKMFPDAYCLGKSKDGFPKHPLYLKSNLKPTKFNQTNDN